VVCEGGGNEDVAEYRKFNGAIDVWSHLRDRKTSKELRLRLCIEGIADLVISGRLKWFGYVECKIVGNGCQPVGI
jgi:hypothetical protein